MITTRQPKFYPVLDKSGGWVDVLVPAQHEAFFIELNRAAYAKGKAGITMDEFYAWLKSEKYLG